MTTTTRIVLLTVAAPITAGAASIALLLSLAPQLPGEFAVHWGVRGVDRVDGLGAFVALIAALVTSFTILMVVAAVLALRAGAPRDHLRLVVATSTWFGVAVSLGVLGSVLLQRDATDPLAVPVSAALVPLLIAALLGGLIAVVVSRLVPAIVEVPRPQSPATSGGITLSPTEAVHWSATVYSPRAVFGIFVGAMVLVAVAFALAGLPWWLSVIVFVLLVAAGSVLGWHIVIDRRGLRATGLFGYPRIVVPAQSVVSATAVDASPLREFGGWGVRFDARGRLGIIVQGGPAIEVERASKRTLVITVPDAASGAAVLASVAQR